MLIIADDPSTVRPGLGSERTAEKLSCGSAESSMLVATDTVITVSPGANVTIIVTDSKSKPAQE